MNQLNMKISLMNSKSKYWLGLFALNNIVILVFIKEHKTFIHFKL
jgi:hypothetical protein